MHMIGNTEPRVNFLTPVVNEKEKEVDTCHWQQHVQSWACMLLLIPFPKLGTLLLNLFSRVRYAITKPFSRIIDAMLQIICLFGQDEIISYSKFLVTWENSIIIFHKINLQMFCLFIYLLLINQYTNRDDNNKRLIFLIRRLIKWRKHRLGRYIMRFSGEVEISERERESIIYLLRKFNKI